jgi:signal transduction histidine kinase
VKRILLLLDHRENQRLLADELAGEHDIVAGSSDADLDDDFDLCIVDGAALDRLWPHVLARKSRQDESFLPILLVTSRSDVKMVTRHLWRSVDELIITPIEKQELRARVEILLRARALSVSLRQRAEDAEHAARTRDEVLAMVAHDLRNPLNLVVTTGAFLLETAAGLEPQQQEQLRMIQRAASQMNRLIQDLLDVAATGSGQVAVSAEDEPIEPLVREACAQLEHAASAAGIKLGCTFGPELPAVHADRGRIMQVLGNLIGNALRFTPAGGSVTVATAREGERVRIAVSDTGEGIDAADLPHVFERFWQARQSRGGGAGLGLAIARGIVAAHGGELRVESMVGDGSSFSFTLPAAGHAGVEATSTLPGES